MCAELEMFAFFGNTVGIPLVASVTRCEARFGGPLRFHQEFGLLKAPSSSCNVVASWHCPKMLGRSCLKNVPCKRRDRYLAM